MAKTIGEVRNFLDSLIGKTTVDKSDSSLNGQCVSLVKNLLEFLGAPNPYSARGNAKDIPNTYISQGIAKKGSGSLNIAVNRYDGGGYGHVWVKIGSDSWQANYAGFPVKKNVGEVAITDILNLDQWISTNNTSGNANETTKRKGETTMQCFFKPDNENTVYYFDGKGITPITNSDEMNMLNAIYKENNGKEMPYIKRTGAWFTRLKDASKRSILK